MKTIIGTGDIPMMECINPIKNKWSVRWGASPADNGLITYMEEVFLHKPSLTELKELIINWHNGQISEKIISGFAWKDVAVWLSSENQFNYKATYDLAIQTSGANLPVTFKFGTNDAPIYYTFTTTEELAEFYTSSLAFITATLTEGWRIKDEIDWTEYEK